MSSYLKEHSSLLSMCIECSVAALTPLIRLGLPLHLEYNTLKETGQFGLLRFGLVSYHENLFEWLSVLDLF